MEVELRTLHIDNLSFPGFLMLDTDHERYKSCFFIGHPLGGSWAPESTLQLFESASVEYVLYKL